MAGTATNVEQIASTENCTVRQINMTISLAFLAPNLVQAVVDGRLPVELASQTCATRRANVPARQARARVVGTFPPWALRRQEQNFYGQRPGPEFGISRRPETG